MNAKKVLKLYEELAALINDYADSTFLPTYRILRSAIYDMKAANSTAEMEKIARESYKSLYPPHGGLSELRFLDPDYKKRVAKNKPLEEIANKLHKEMTD